MSLFLSILLVALIVSGCAKEPKRAAITPMKPTAARIQAPQNLTAEDPCVTRFGKPCVTNQNSYTGKFLLKWDYFENLPGIVFVVRSTNRLDVPVKSWPAVVTSNKFYAVTNMGAAAFFAVSASNPATGDESEFAR